MTPTTVFLLITSTILVAAMANPASSRFGLHRYRDNELSPRWTPNFASAVPVAKGSKQGRSCEGQSDVGYYEFPGNCEKFIQCAYLPKSEDPNSFKLYTLYEFSCAESTHSTVAEVTGAGPGSDVHCIFRTDATNCQ